MNLNLVKRGDKENTGNMHLIGREQLSPTYNVKVMQSAKHTL